MDLANFDTAMSARDVDAVRRALGARRIRLVAASYGTHLALAVIRRFEPHVDRAVLALVEGPDHTIKLPSQVDRHLRKVSDLLAAHPSTSSTFSWRASATRVGSSSNRPR